jgi:hypothetical protein
MVKRKKRTKKPTPQQWVGKFVHAGSRLMLFWSFAFAVGMTLVAVATLLNFGFVSTPAKQVAAAGGINLSGLSLYLAQALVIVVYTALVVYLLYLINKWVRSFVIWLSRLLGIAEIRVEISLVVAIWLLLLTDFWLTFMTGLDLFLSVALAGAIINSGGFWLAHKLKS